MSKTAKLEDTIIPQQPQNISVPCPEPEQSPQNESVLLKKRARKDSQDALEHENEILRNLFYSTK